MFIFAKMFDMNRQIIYLLCLGVSGYVAAEETSNNRQNATLKAEYEAIHVLADKEGNPKEDTSKWILQLAAGSSYYYNPQTFFVDSLMNDPNGKAIHRAVWDEALEEFTRTGADAMQIVEEKGMMRESQYKCLKDYGEEKMTVWDVNFGDAFRYSVPMDDLVWEITDSTKNVMGYECQKAEAEYHGRKWSAWFAPEISVPDGPWQLYGLPGLIMEAASVDGDYKFIIKGLQKCNEPLKDPYEKENIYTSKRKNFLKQKDYTRRNRSARLAAMTNGEVNVKNADYTGTDDFLETDYHE